MILNMSDTVYSLIKNVFSVLLNKTYTLVCYCLFLCFFLGGRHYLSFFCIYIFMYLFIYFYYFSFIYLFIYFIYYIFFFFFFFALFQPIPKNFFFVLERHHSSIHPFFHFLSLSL